MLSGPTMLSEQSLPTALQLKIYSQLTFFIEGDDVDFRQVDVIACDLYARTSSVGAEHVRRTCAEIIQPSALNNKEQ
ncbi:hypothetical protein SLEP1_g43233 [Rubroshorea leprosula]|uniref:Uncharacterized protein n=1 Tax=Rubroshorea leprosula TaxID=152421 RepID=A0AAV5LCB5_9ROSI|nr:hypothetical protein SLEP1_g43233 [Rubroshorea leprosula]